MALRMPRPIAHASGVHHLNIWVSSDIVGKVRGTAVTFPLGDARVTVRPSDKVILSLRTRDLDLAKALFLAAAQALLLHWDAVRRGPAPLTHKQWVALAGECYRAGVERFEADPDFVPDGYLAAVRQLEVDVACWRYHPDDGYGEVSERDAKVLAALALPHGPQLLEPV